MIQAQLSTRTSKKLCRIAAARDTSISELLDLAIERYLTDEPPLRDVEREETKQDERLKQIEREQKAYEAQHNHLLETYPGQYIAMRQGQMVDHDMDRTRLGQRVRSRYGNETILITPVRREARQTIVVRSPRLARPVRETT